MPTKKSSAAKKSHGSKPAAATPKKALIKEIASFNAGDVVLEIGTNRVGTVCRVVTAGLSYNVRFADDTQCSVMMQSALTGAPNGQAGPECTDDC